MQGHVRYALDGDVVTFSGTRSLDSVTTTVEPPPATHDPSRREPVPALFGCDNLSAREREFLQLLEDGLGEIDGPEMTIRSETASATLRGP